MSMKKIIGTVLILIAFLTGCVNGPAIKEVYTGNNRIIKKTKAKALLYKIIVEGDNYDPFIPDTVHDNISLSLQNSKLDVTTYEDVFNNDIDHKNIAFKPDALNGEYDYIIVVIIRSKNLGYSLTTLSDETNIFINILLHDGEGKLLTSSQVTRITSYSISASRRFYKDLWNSLWPVKSFIFWDQVKKGFKK